MSPGVKIAGGVRTLASALDRSARQIAARDFAGFDADKPAAGFYRTRLVSGGMPVGIRIWFGAPFDPVPRP